MYLVFDTETTGLPKRWNAPISDTDNWPRVVQIAWQLHNQWGDLVESESYLIQPNGYNIPYDAEKVHGISTALATEKGVHLNKVLALFEQAMAKSTFLVGHNLGFDIKVTGAEFYRSELQTVLTKMPVLDTCTETTATLGKFKGGRAGRYKLPTLSELHHFLFNQKFEEAHNATADVEATARSFFELIRLDVFTNEALKQPAGFLQQFKNKHTQPIKKWGLKHLNLKSASEKTRLKQLKSQKTEAANKSENITLNRELVDAPFAHLHNHSRFSVLQATSGLDELVTAAGKDGMHALALTDLANMMGSFLFLKEVKRYNEKIAAAADAENLDKPTPIKPILGCEFYVCDDHSDRTRRDNGYRVVFLAKNKEGYHNLAKMSSLAYTRGFYYVPRIDRSIVEKYKEHLIVLSGNLYGEVPGKILNVGEKQAVEALLWWKEQFGSDFYLEIMRHGQEDEDRVNESLAAFSKTYGVKLVATNGTCYVTEDDAQAHDILLCAKDGEKLSTPIGRGRGYRFGMPNKQYYFKGSDEMKALFTDLPEAIINIKELTDKISVFELARDVLLPKFSIPSEFMRQEGLHNDSKEAENAYLRFLTYQGAKNRYGDDLSTIKERLDFELGVIKRTGYPGYFLIVQDLIVEARRQNVSVGPGRGSAAGSAVAYCLGITNIDPIRYNLLFERFLNPDRVSLPDIDIDFDDEGRSRVIDYVIEKYGRDQVAQIITYGTMAAKSSIRDTARVLDLPLNDADRLAKLVPNLIKLHKIFNTDDTALRKNLRSDEWQSVAQLKQISKGAGLEAQTINLAQVLEGSLRNTGVHACGVIITPTPITDFVPVATAKDSDLVVTQFDNSVVENAGLLKMDFLGLKTLSLIKDTIKLVKHRHEIVLDADTFPLDDEKTYKLFQNGETVGIFQYESAGMQRYMKELLPTTFADLIAMNALYRPGPLEYIPSFIRRKRGTEDITYDLPVMQEILEETYGITVYQEQVMLLSQKLAGFTKGEADVLRKAMGKKIFALLEQLKPKFIQGGINNGHPEEKLEKIWKDWQAFASYAFNKSHSTCYALIGYQTAWLKANYPAEYMAAVLSNNMSDIKQISFFLEESRRMGIKVLGPDVNESFYKFTVNKNGAIRFGMGAVKGVGRNAVETIVKKRAKGLYTSVFDMASRVDLRAANKKAFENLALAGGFDSFKNSHRAQYFYAKEGDVILLEKILKQGAKVQKSRNSSQLSLFDIGSAAYLTEPKLPEGQEWGTLETLRREKEVVGIYISGHPLDDFKTELNAFCSGKVGSFLNLEKYINREISFGGIISDVRHRISKNGRGWAQFVIEDFTDSVEFKIFGEDYLKFRHFLVDNAFVYLRVFVREGWTNKDTGEKSDPRLQYNSISQLQEVMDTQAKKLTIKLNIEKLQQKRITELKKLFAAHKGKKTLNFVVYEMQNKIKLHMPSQKQKVKISSELLSELDKQKLHYTLN